MISRVEFRLRTFSNAKISSEKRNLCIDIRYYLARPDLSTVSLLLYPCMIVHSSMILSTSSLGLSSRLSPGAPFQRILFISLSYINILSTSTFQPSSLWIPSQISIYYLSNYFLLFSTPSFRIPIPLLFFSTSESSKIHLYILHSPRHCGNTCSHIPSIRSRKVELRLLTGFVTPVNSLPCL